MALIRGHWLAHGNAPTLAEIAAVLEVHKNAIKGHVVALKKKGAVDWAEGKVRTLRVLITEEEEEDEDEAFYGDDE